MASKIKIKFKGKEAEVEAERVSLFGSALGLMFKGKNTKNLLFEFKRDTRTSIHSLFVFFRFLAIWLDKDNNVVDFRIVKPFSIDVNSKSNFRRLLEIPLNDRNRKLAIMFFLDDKKKDLNREQLKTN